MVDRILAEWRKSLETLLTGPFFQALGEGRLGVEHYKGLLREIYYNTRENPPSFALMAGHLKGAKRDLGKRILRHAAAEMGHHELALDDLKALGVDVKGIPSGRPLPTTEALIAFAVYHVQHGNPLTYLGYVYHLEMLPAQLGPRFIANLITMGVPQKAMTFLTEHAHADVGHTRLLEEYFRDAIETEKDLEAVIHGVKGTCRLHGIMLQGVLEDVSGKSDWSPVGRPAPVAVPKVDAPLVDAPPIDASRAAAVRGAGRKG